MPSWPCGLAAAAPGCAGADRRAGAAAVRARCAQRAALGGQRFAVQNRINLLVQLALSVLLFVLWRTGWLQPESALGLQLAAHVLWIVAARSVPAETTVAPPSSDLPLSPPPPDASASDFAGARAGHRAAQLCRRAPRSLLLRIDIYLIEKLVPPAVMAHELGPLSGRVRVAELVLFVPSTLNAVLFAKGRGRRRCRAVYPAERQAFAVAGDLGLGVHGLVGQPLLVLVFGARFAGSFAPVCGCSWAA